MAHSSGHLTDKPELREYYGSANTSTKRQNAYPVMRLVALMNLGSHILLNAVTAPYRQSETVLAHSMLATIPDNSITLFDKLFYSEDLLLTLNQKGCAPSGAGRDRGVLAPATGYCLRGRISHQK